MNALTPPTEIVVPGVEGQGSERFTIPLALLETYWKWDESDHTRSRAIFLDIRKEVRYEFDDARLANPTMPALDIVKSVLPPMVRHVVYKHGVLARIAERNAEEKVRRAALSAPERASEDADFEQRYDEFRSQVHIVCDGSFDDLPPNRVEFVGFRDDDEFDIPSQDREFDSDWFRERPGQRFRLCTAFEREINEAGWEPRGKHTVLRLSHKRAEDALPSFRLFEVRCAEVVTINGASDAQLDELFNSVAGRQAFVKVGHYTPRPYAKNIEPASPAASLIRKPVAGNTLYESRCMADIVREPIEWLWPDRIPLGKITTIAGDPKLGKSQITCALTAALSTGGSFPDNTRAPLGSVILVTCEDDPEDTIGPRLDAAGADSKKIHLLDWTVRREGSAAKRKHFDIGQDAEALEAMVQDIGDVKAIIIDPISAYMGKADSHKNADVRGALIAIQTLAAKHSIAVVLVSHLNKNSNGQNAKARVAGSGFVAVSRCNWLVVEDSADETGERRFFCPLGTNIAKGATGFAYRIIGVDLGNGIKTSKVVFEGQEIALNADDLLSCRQEAPGAVACAADLLRSVLADGPQAQKQVEHAAREAGVSEASLKRAKKQLSVVSKKNGVSGWIWSLPSTANLERPGAALW